MFRKHVVNLMACLAVSSVLTAAQAQAQSNCSSAIRQQIQLLDEQAQNYRNYLANYCSRQEVQQVCAMMRTWLNTSYPAQRQQLLARCTTTPPNTNPPTGCTRDQFCRAAQSRGQGLLQSFNGLPNRLSYTYKIGFSYPPDYQGQCNWTPSRNGYTVSGYEFQRTVSSLMNRCNLITSVSYYR